MKGKNLFDAIGEVDGKLAEGAAVTMNGPEKTPVMPLVLRVLSTSASVVFVVALVLVIWISSIKMRDPVTPADSGTAGSVTSEQTAADTVPADTEPSRRGAEPSDEDAMSGALCVSDEGVEEFMKALEGCLEREGENAYYNVDGSNISSDSIRDAYNVTPDGFYEATGATLFKTSPNFISFVFKDGEIHRLKANDWSGGLGCAVPCDFDGNGVYDFLYTSTGGSGVTHISVNLFDMTAYKSYSLFFSQEYFGGGIFIGRFCDGVCRLYNRIQTRESEQTYINIGDVVSNGSGPLYCGVFDSDEDLGAMLDKIIRTLETYRPDESGVISGAVSGIGVSGVGSFDDGKEIVMDTSFKRIYGVFKTVDLTNAPENVTEADMAAMPGDKYFAVISPLSSRKSTRLYVISGGTVYHSLHAAYKAGSVSKELINSLKPYLGSYYIDPDSMSDGFRLFINGEDQTDECFETNGKLLKEPFPGVSFNVLMQKLGADILFLKVDNPYSVSYSLNGVHFDMNPGTGDIIARYAGEGSKRYSVEFSSTASDRIFTYDSTVKFLTDAGIADVAVDRENKVIYITSIN